MDVHRFDGAVELQAGLEPEPVGGVGDHLEQAAPQPTRRRRRALQGEHRRAQLLDGLIEPVDGRLEPGPGPLRIAHAGQRGLEAQTLGEEPLDHRVVQVAGDPLTILGHGQHLFGLAQRVLAVAQLRFDGQTGRDVPGQGDHRPAAIPARSSPNAASSRRVPPSRPSPAGSTAAPATTSRQPRSVVDEAAVLGLGRVRVQVQRRHRQQLVAPVARPAAPPHR